MARFFRGAGVGTHWHTNNPHHHGFTPHNPGGFYNPSTCIQHITVGPSKSPCVSLTKSFAVAEDYALEWSSPPATSANPAFVYEVDIPDPAPAPLVVLDPVFELAHAHRNPLLGVTYHHDGDMKFLLGVTDPIGMASNLRQAVRQPPGSTATPRTPILTPCLEAFVRALRDAEILVIGGIPPANVINTYAVY